MHHFLLSSLALVFCFAGLLGCHPVHAVRVHEHVQLGSAGSFARGKELRAGRCAYMMYHMYIYIATQQDVCEDQRTKVSKTETSRMSSHQ